MPKRASITWANMSTKLRHAGVPIVAGTDGYGHGAGPRTRALRGRRPHPRRRWRPRPLSPARNVKVDNRTGSITVGKEADLLLVDGDPEKNIGDLRHVDQVMSDGVLMDGEALREAAGFSGKPK